MFFSGLLRDGMTECTASACTAQTCPPSEHGHQHRKIHPVVGACWASRDILWRRDRVFTAIAMTMGEIGLAGVLGMQRRRQKP